MANNGSPPLPGPPAAAGAACPVSMIDAFQSQYGVEVRHLCVARACRARAPMRSPECRSIARSWPACALAWLAHAPCHQR